MTNTTPPSVLITGAARRIGAALARHFHEKGFYIFVHYHTSMTEANNLTDALNAIRPQSAQAIQGSLDDMSDIQRIAQSVLQQDNSLDILINNASSFFPTPIENATETHWNTLINSNLKAPYFLSQRLSPALKKSHGCIINISDIFADRPMPGYSIYSIAKAGNNMLTKSLALELSPSIRVNGIAPGAILWPENDTADEATTQKKLHHIPAKKLGGTDAIVKAANYLAIKDNYLTGEIIHVDGGRRLNQ